MFTKIKLISCLILIIVLNSCNQDKKNIEWLIAKHDGDFSENLGDEVQFKYVLNYVYVTSKKLDEKYGYLFMDRIHFKNLYENKSNVNFSKREFNDVMIIIQGKIDDKSKLKSIVSFIIDFNKNQQNEFIPHLVRIENEKFNFQYYEKYHRSNIKDTLIRFTR